MTTNDQYEDFFARVWEEYKRIRYAHRVANERLSTDQEVTQS